MKSRLVIFRLKEDIYMKLLKKAGLMSVNEYCKYLVLREGDRKHSKEE